MEKNWSHNQFNVKEGLKPGAKHFQYFFVVSEGDLKRCRYCVWIEDEALSRLDSAGNRDAIIASHRDWWTRWVKDKLDEGDFRDVVLKYGKEGKTEVELSSLDEKLTVE